MIEAVATYFGSQSFMPHGHCFLWRPSLLWLFILSDSIIALSYYSIPLALVYFVHKRKDLQFNRMFIMFSLFIFACGTTHLIGLWTIWNPDYWLDGIVKAITAAVSFVTAILLWPLIPKALRLPSPQHLQLAIKQMENEVFERKQMEAKLESLNQTLESRVAVRTAELERINRQLQAEIESRKAAEMRFKKVVEHVPNGMIMTSNQGIIEMVNAQTETIFGYARSELLGKPIEVLVPSRSRGHHPSLRESFFAKPDPRPMGEGRDLYGLRKDGSEVPVEIALNPMENESDLMVLAAVVDISDRKQRENRLQAALKEKTTLLAEVHHRVKNNLQLVHSLLDLQASQTEDPSTKEILSNSMRRINSMSIIHQALYQSNDFAKVDLSDVLNTLVDNIANSYNINTNNIKLLVDVESVALPITQAIPCGLIVNELVTNALKHAFPKGKAGTIEIKLTLEGEGQAVLTVMDNGIGIGAEVDLDNMSTLGLELVTVLSEQIGGIMTVQRMEPTQFDIKFNLQRV